MKTSILKHLRSQPPKIFLSVIVFCFLLGATFVAIIFPLQTLSSVNQFEVKEMAVLPPIEPGTVVTQTFEATGDFSGFGLLFASYGQILDQGTVEVEIYHQQNLIDTCSAEAKNLLDLAFFHCDFIMNKGEQYKLLIFTENMPNPVTFLSTTAQVDHATLMVNKKPQDRIIIMDFTEQRNNYMLAWFFALLMNLDVCYLAANLKKETYDAKKS